jgi:hypothetical protein
MMKLSRGDTGLSIPSIDSRDCLGKLPQSRSGVACRRNEQAMSKSLHTLTL